LPLRKPCGAFVEAEPKHLQCVTCHKMRPVALFVRHCSVQKGKGILKRFKKCNGCSTKAIRAYKVSRKLTSQTKMFLPHLLNKSLGECKESVGKSRITWLRRICARQGLKCAYCDGVLLRRETTHTQCRNRGNQTQSEGFQPGSYSKQYSDPL